MDFATMKALVQYLETAGLSNADLAKRIKCSESYISHLLNGARIPSAQVLKKLHDATGISYDKLMESIRKL